MNEQRSSMYLTGMFALKKMSKSVYHISVIE